ncbi:MAG TPA: thioredoxin family protein [Pyrinomonadaceae bacterium]
MILKSFLFTIFLIAFTVPINAQKIEWTSDYAAAEKIARQTGKPLLLDFTTVWCGLCRLMDAKFWTRSDVIEISKQFVSVKLDGEKEELLAKRFGVSQFPAVVVADPWSAGIDSHTGFGQNADRVIAGKAASFPKDFNELKKSGDALEKNQNDSSALHDFAAFYSQRKLYNLSIELYKKVLKVENTPAKREAALYNLAADSLKIGRYGEALTYFETLQKEFPQSLQAEMVEYGIFNSHLGKNNLAEAEKHLAKFKANFPHSKIITQAEQALQNRKSRN